MIGLLIWLSAFALTNITARPVAEPYDWYTPSTDAISTDNYPSAGSSFTEAATFKQEEPNDEEPNIDPVCFTVAVYFLFILFPESLLMC